MTARRNCCKCGRWRYLAIDFTPGQGQRCRACSRAYNRRLQGSLPDLGPEPMRSWIRARVSDYGSIAALARVVGVDESLLRRMLKRGATVKASTVDRLLAAEGSASLEELYGPALDEHRRRIEELSSIGR
jgi:transposase-like protein